MSKTVFILAVFLASPVLVAPAHSGDSQSVPSVRPPDFNPEISSVVGRLPRMDDGLLKIDNMDSIPPDSVDLWTYGGIFALNFQQVGLRNWQAGGESAISIGGRVILNLKYADYKQVWSNRFRSEVGYVRWAERGWRKTIDELVLTSSYSRKLRKFVFASALVDFRTQYRPGYNFTTDSTGAEIRGNSISDFLAPGYIQGALGVSYKTANIGATLSPIATKVTIVTNDRLASQGAFGVEAGKKIRTQVGAMFNAFANYEELTENVALASSLILFSDYERPENIDVDWDFSLIFTVNDFIQSSISLRMIYDDDINVQDTNGDGEFNAPGLQIANTITVGLQYKI